eukprot:714622_1
MEPAIQILHDNVDNIGNLETFISMTPKCFKDTIHKHAKIDGSIIRKLYVGLFNSLQKLAQVKQFGTFLSDLCMDDIDHHYHHIIVSHIDNGDRDTIKNTFKFFNTAIHYQDTDISNCISNQRRRTRLDEMMQQKNKK